VTNSNWSNLLLQLITAFYPIWLFNYICAENKTKEKVLETIKKQAKFLCTTSTYQKKSFQNKKCFFWLFFFLLFVKVVSVDRKIVLAKNFKLWNSDLVCFANKCFLLCKVWNYFQLELESSYFQSHVKRTTASLYIFTVINKDITSQKTH
jgi:hypothetical protein